VADPPFLASFIRSRASERKKIRHE